MASIKLTETTTSIQSATLVKRSLNYKLEFLRGVAALLVVYHHAIVHKFVLDSVYMPGGLWKFEAPGHLSVLVFFVLSGYVIRLTNGTPIVGEKIPAYLKKRFVRIYPIYAFAVLFTWFAFFPKYDIKILLGNLLFLQIFNERFFMWENIPVWSLNYEVVYYVLFIFISYFRLNIKLLSLISFIIPIGLLLLYNGRVNRHLLEYFVFFCFWIFGAIIADKYRNVDWHGMNSVLLMSSVCSFISLEYFDMLHTILNKVLSFIKLHSVPSASNWVSNIGIIKDFCFLPFCIVIILLFVGVKNRLLSYGYYALQLLNALTLVYLYQHRHDSDIERFVIPGIFFLVGVLLLFWQKNKRLNAFLERFIHRGAIVGSISYGIYIIHFPILASFKAVQAFGGNGMTFLGRFSLLVGLSILVAYFLEKKFQPLAVHFFSKKKPDLLKL